MMFWYIQRRLLRFPSAGRSTGCIRRQRAKRNQEAMAVRPIAGRSRSRRPMVMPANEETAGRNICGIWKIRLRDILRRAGSYSTWTDAEPDTFDILHSFHPGPPKPAMVEN